MIDMTYCKYLFLIVCLYSSALHAEKLKVVPSLDLHFATWTGEDVGGGGTYTSGSVMKTLGVMLQKDRWYSGLLLKSGNFKFEGVVPEQNTGLVIDPSEIGHGDFDLIAGYYLWNRVSLFVDLKSTSMEWIDNNYVVAFGGVGFGISGYYPLKASVLYSSFGLVSLVSTVDKVEVGTGGGSSFEFGWMKKLSASISLKIGVKSQTQVIDFTANEQQQNHIGGLVIGLNRAFTL